MVCIGGIAYLSVDTKLIGAILFSFALLSIVFFKLDLYTGKVGYILHTKEWINLAVTGLFNVIGVWIGTLYIRITPIYDKIYEPAKTLALAKLQTSYTRLFLLGIGCGVLMFLAVESYKNYKNIFFLIFCIVMFIICGFEHSIADTFYFMVSGNFHVIPFFVILAGNSVGSIVAEKMLKA